MNLNANLKSAAESAPPSQNHLLLPRRQRAAGKISGSLLLTCLLAWTCSSFSARADDLSSSAKLHLDCRRDPIWQNGVGCGFQKHAVEAGFSIGAGAGMAVFGSQVPHDLAIGEVHVGTMLTGTMATNHWWRGNFELLGSLFGGVQFNPNDRYLVGIGPMLRYNFATGSCLVPFIGGGAGASLTDIRRPDLSTDFEFNLQADGGIHCFFRRNMAVTVEGRWLHLSNAGIDHPNNGVNTPLGMLGLTWWF
jgi:lipid A 3-O-deacylase